MKELTLIIFVAMLVLGLLPLIVAFAGIGLASLFGCTQEGAEIKSCVVFGVNIGPTLTTMMMMHWLGILSLPIAALGAVGLTIRAAILFALHLRG